MEVIFKKISVCDVVEKFKHMFTVGSNVKWYNPYRKQYKGFTNN
jgi:hypothetical protein